jgi:hypothetical protein
VLCRTETQRLHAGRWTAARGYAQSLVMKARTQGEHPNNPPMPNAAGVSAVTRGKKVVGETEDATFAPKVQPIVRAPGDQPSKKKVEDSARKDAPIAVPKTGAKANSKTRRRPTEGEAGATLSPLESHDLAEVDTSAGAEPTDCEDPEIPVRRPYTGSYADDADSRLPWDKFATPDEWRAKRDLDLNRIRQQQQDERFAAMIFEPPRKYKPRLGDKIFGPLPRVPGEDPEAYRALVHEGFESLEPKNLFEEIWIRDLVDYAWEMGRLTRLKADVLLSDVALEVAERTQRPLAAVLADCFFANWFAGAPQAPGEVEKMVASVGMSVEALYARSLVRKADSIGRIDRIYFHAASRRDEILKEIESQREAFDDWTPTRMIPPDKAASGAAVVGPPCLIPGEDWKKYKALLKEISRALRPHDAFEENWARDIADSVWQGRRLHRVKGPLLQMRAVNAPRSNAWEEKPDLTARLDEIELMNQMLSVVEARRVATHYSIHEHRRVRNKFAKK